MKITKETENGVMTVFLKGKLDTGTSPQAESEIFADLDSADKLILDMKELAYLSSAGLRLLLKLQKTMKEKDGMTVRNVNSDIEEIFDMTGFTSILDIE